MGDCVDKIAFDAVEFFEGTGDAMEAFLPSVEKVGNKTDEQINLIITRATEMSNNVIEDFESMIRSGLEWAGQPYRADVGIEGDQVVMDKLDDPISEVRHAAIMAISRLGIEDAVPEILKPRFVGWRSKISTARCFSMTA